MTLPSTLTFNIVGPIAIASGTQFNSGQKPKLHVLNTLQTLINSSSYWQVDVVDMTGSMIEALVLRPQAVKSALPNMRIIATMNQSGVLGGAANANTLQDRTAGTPDSFLLNTLQLGFSPDVSNAPTWVTGSWNSDRPWGNTVRFSKYWQMPAGQNASIDVMYLIESSETLGIGCKGFAGSVASFFWYGGAICASYDSGSGELAQRIYGMFLNGTTTMTNNFNTVTNASPWGHAPGVNSDHMGVWIVSGGSPNVAANGGVAQNNANYWELCNKLMVGTLTRQTDGGDRGSNTTSDGNLVVLPIPIISTVAPFRSIGYARQVYMTQDYPALLAVTTGSNTSMIQGYTLSQDQMIANDALMFLNFLPAGAQ